MPLFLRPLHLAFPNAGWRPDPDHWAVMLRQEDGAERYVGVLNRDGHRRGDWWRWGLPAIYLPPPPVVPLGGVVETREAAMAALRAAWDAASVLPEMRWHAEPVRRVRG